MEPLLTKSYDYTLPKELIATEPISPRDSCKLLIYDRKTKDITHTIFSKIDEFIPKDCAILCNDTKVIKARIFGKKSSGGKIELLINKPLSDINISCFIRGKVHIGSILYFKNGLIAKTVKLNEDGSRVVNFIFEDKIVPFQDLILLLEKIGHIPLPPYIQREDKKSDEIEYQTIFSKNAGAVAAPTASLHFTKELFQNLKDSHDLQFLTLHVGAGTFKPVESEIITEHPMHSEFYHIPKPALQLIEQDRALLAIGTTVTRTVEYYMRTKEISGEANLFLHPQNPPIRVNHLLTNFHLPKSTLLMLVASFIGLKQTHRVYEEAIKNRYRFFSYGDAMLII